MRVSRIVNTRNSSSVTSSQYSGPRQIHQSLSGGGPQASSEGFSHSQFQAPNADCLRERRPGSLRLFQSRVLADAAHFHLGHAAVLFEHPAHVGVLLENLVDLLDRSAASAGDALPTLAVDQVVVG